MRCLILTFFNATSTLYSPEAALELEKLSIMQYLLFELHDSQFS